MEDGIGRREVGLQRTRGKPAVSFYVQLPHSTAGSGPWRCLWYYRLQAPRLSWAASPHRRQGKAGAERRSVERSWVGRPKRPAQALWGSRGEPPGERVTFLRSEAKQKLT